jgi:hypothetical protein
MRPPPAHHLLRALLLLLLGARALAAAAAVLGGSSTVVAAAILRDRCPVGDVGCIAGELQARLSLRQLMTLDAAIQQSSSAPAGREERATARSSTIAGASESRHGWRWWQRRRRLLMDTSLDPAQKIVSVRSHAPDFHPTTVGGADPESLQPLFQPSLEGYYPYMGYETATPQCKRVLNRYFGKCMFGIGGGGGGHRFRQVGLRENAKGRAGTLAANRGTSDRVSGPLQRAADENRAAADTGSAAGTMRGGDAAFRDSMDFAEAIADGGVTEDLR